MNLEMYDNLKGEIGERAARVIAEAIPPGQELVTKSDILATKSELRSEIQLAVAHLEGRIDRLGADMMRWMLTFFVPLWLGVYGTLAAVIVTLIVRG